MWYRMQLAGLDAGKRPLILDKAGEEGKHLPDVAASVGCQLVALAEHLRGTELAFLEGFGYLTVEVQKWASLNSFERLGEGDAARLRAMRAYVMDALYFGPGSPKTATPTTHSGFFRNSR